MDLPGRGSMDDDTFRREIFFHVNRGALKKLLEDTRSKLAELYN